MPKYVKNSFFLIYSSYFQKIIVYLCAIIHILEMKKIIAIALSMTLFAPAIAQRQTVIKAEKVRKEAKVPVVRNDKNSRPTNEVMVSGEHSKNSAYKNLTAQKSMISQQINALSAELQQSKKGVSKKISKQLEVLSNQLTITERLLATFPQPTDGEQTRANDDKLFKLQLDSIAAIRIAATDPFAGQLSDDPELDRLYRDYLTQNGTTPMMDVDSDGGSAEQHTIYNSGDKVFRVMIAISRNAMPASSFSDLTDVMEQKMPAGGYAYYQGQYATASEAERACRSILAQRRFRDAFVVAMVGNKRVSIN